jgi:hypothetical protein
VQTGSSGFSQVEKRDCGVPVFGSPVVPDQISGDAGNPCNPLANARLQTKAFSLNALIVSAALRGENNGQMTRQE